MPNTGRGDLRLWAKLACGGTSSSRSGLQLPAATGWVSAIEDN